MLSNIGKIIFLKLLSGIICQTAIASNCRINLSADDSLEFIEKSLTIPNGCKNVYLNLSNLGKYPKEIMGHGVMVVREKDFRSISRKILAGTDSTDFIPNSPKIVAASKILSGGQKEVISFKVSKSENLVYFCHHPGHHSISKGSIN